MGTRVGMIVISLKFKGEISLKISVEGFSFSLSFSAKLTFFGKFWFQKVIFSEKIHEKFKL